MRKKLEKIPLKNAYLLGSVDLPQQKKQSILESYQGEGFKDWRKKVVKSNTQKKPRDENLQFLKTSLNALKKIKTESALTENSKEIVNEILELLTSLC